MRKLTEQTGGRVINVGNKFDKLKEAFDQIAAELRSQYNIGYTPTNTKLDGSYRKLEIKSKQNYKIQARCRLLRRPCGSRVADTLRYRGQLELHEGSLFPLGSPVPSR